MWFVFRWYTMPVSDGSFITMMKFFGAHRLMDCIPFGQSQPFTLQKLLLTFGVFEALLEVFLPREHYHGPLLPIGHRPLYKKNGLATFVVTLALYYIIWRVKIFNPSIVYDCLGEMLSTSIFLSLVFCGILFVKHPEMDFSKAKMC